MQWETPRATDPDGAGHQAAPSVPASRGRALDLATGVVVLLSYAAVRLALLQPPQRFDPATYFGAATRFPDVPANLWTLRIGLVVPVHAAVRVFGPSEAALYAVPLLVGLVLAGAVYGTMLVLFGDRILAATAALATVLSPLFLLNSSFIFPDPAATAIFTAGFLLLIVGARSVEEASTRWLPAVAVAGAGALFGWAYLAREASPILLPAVAAAVVLLRYSARRILLLGGAALATAALDPLFARLIWGRPLVHAELLLRRDERVRSPRAQDVLEGIREELGGPLEALLVFPRLALAWQTGWIVLLLVAIFGVALVRFRRDRRLWLLAAWCLSFWGIMTVFAFVSDPTGLWILNVSNVRYWYPLLPPLTMGAFGGLALLLLLRPPGRVSGMRLVRAAAVALAALAVLPGLAEYRSCSERSVWRDESRDRWNELRSWLATEEAQPYDVVFTDRRTSYLLPVFTRTTFGSPLWEGEIKRYGSRFARDPGTETARSLIVLYQVNFRRAARLLPDWSPAFSTSDGKMVVLAHGLSAAGADEPWWDVPEWSRPETAGCGINPYL